MLTLHRTFLVSLKAATRSAAGASAARAGRSVMVRSEREGRQRFELATGSGPQGTQIWVRSNRTALRLGAWRGRPGGGGQRGKPQPHPSLFEVDRVERPFVDGTYAPRRGDLGGEDAGRVDPVRPGCAAS